MSVELSPLPDYAPITETPRTPATRPQVKRLIQRYDFAERRTRGRRTLEVACGAGIGLGYLARTASSVVGGDATASALRLARAHYGSRVPLVRFDAHVLPFADGVFDAIVVFEAIYYFRDLARVLNECRRVLAPGGAVLISSVNPRWAGFTPSSFSTRYFSHGELCAILSAAGFQVDGCYGGFPTHDGTAVDQFVERSRRVAASLHLIPKTLGARAWLKRIFYGPTATLMPELTPGADTAPAPVELRRDDVDQSHQILYVAARVP
jgi:ubiquinone/menaquinone biosynthesis C-methylase UbiE